MNKTVEFKEKVQAVKGVDFKVLGEYKTAKTKIEMTHITCGYRWETLPSNFLKTKFGCPKCSGNARVTHKEFVDKVRSVSGDEYTVVGNYVNARTIVEFIHNSCGHSYSTTPESFLNLGTRCPKCAGTIRRTDKEFKELVHRKVQGEYVFLDTYKNNATKLRCSHNPCGYTWKITPANFLDRHARCPKCAGNAPLTNETFTERVYSEFEGEYIFLEKYKNFVTPIRCKHVCGNEWMLAPNNLFSGRRCPRCVKESKGEEFVRKVLEESSVAFEAQKTFERCVHKKYLPFDFYVPEVNLAIEYDGEQHYRPIDFGGRGMEHAKKMFELTKKRDSIKTNYCSENSIRLLRIPYHLSKEEAKELILKTIQTVKK